MSLRFGVEIELLLQSKKAYKTWASLANDISMILSQARIRNTVPKKTIEDYSMWSIVPEVTIPDNLDNNFRGIELVSPIYQAADFFWVKDIETIFTALQTSKGFSIHPCSKCSTHVHVSEADGPLSAFHLANLAKAVLYFESTLDCLMPETRQSSNYWGASNTSSRAFKNTTNIQECIAILDKAVQTTNDTVAVVRKMNLCSAKSAYGMSHGKKEDFVRGKTFKWNFCGILSKSESGGTGTGTVEFRQPPGSIAAFEAAAWITLTVAFVAGTVYWDSQTTMGSQGPTLEELYSVVRGGANSLGWGELGYVEYLFKPGPVFDDQEGSTY